jgi:antitoxin VapB
VTDDPRRPPDWDDFFAALKDAAVPNDFLDAEERALPPPDRDPFEGWSHSIC